MTLRSYLDCRAALILAESPRPNTERACGYQGGDHRTGKAVSPSQPRPRHHRYSLSRLHHSHASFTKQSVFAAREKTKTEQHSVRGFLASVVRKRLKLKLGSKKLDGTRVYQIAGGKSGPRRSKRQSS